MKVFRFCRERQGEMLALFRRFMGVNAPEHVRNVLNEPRAMVPQKRQADKKDETSEDDVEITIQRAKKYQKVDESGKTGDGDKGPD